MEEFIQADDFDSNAVELMKPPDKYEYTKEEFLDPAPYEQLYRFIQMPFVFQGEVDKMAARAKQVGFVGFKRMLKTFLEVKQTEKRQSMVPNQTEFDDQAMELCCGIWQAGDWGIYRDTAIGGKDYACAHPIMPVERLVNIDTGEVKVKLAFKRSGKDKRWVTTIVGKDVISTARSITSLASQGISVTSSTASALVDYLNDMENLNYDIIPESKSIGRMGYIEGEGFSPYVEDLVFDGDASFRNLYNCVNQTTRKSTLDFISEYEASLLDWLSIAKECRSMSVTAKILLAASFASPLLSVVGSLPFFVHLWGVDSGTGKTVALMLAASVWGNPAVGSYVQTFNGTQVGQERTAAFLNHLPMCLDELQLTRNSKGQSNFDVYQLAQGVGRARGRKNGGVDAAPTWSCCFLTTGESPIVSGAAGAGAVNRVIDIECTAGSVVIKDGHRIAGALKQCYGNAGCSFIQHLYDPDGLEERLHKIRDVYQDFFKELCEGDSTEKQAMAAAAILTADLCVNVWLDSTWEPLTVKEIADFLASKASVSAGNRAYEFLCDWVAANPNHFYGGVELPTGEVYGKLDGDTAYIIRGVFDKVIRDAGFSTTATLSYLKTNKLIDTRSDKGYTKTTRIGKTTPQCIWLRLPSECDDSDLELLPF